MGHSILQAGSSPFHPREAVEADPLVELERAWARSDALFAFLGPERLAARPIGLRHPCLFYLGHLPAFAWNQVGRGVLERPPVHPTFGRLFERGIDPKDQAEAEASAIEGWPEVAEVVAYREAVREQIRTLGKTLDLDSSDPLAHRARVLWLIIEHERMHHETLLYMLQELPSFPWITPPVFGAGVPPERRTVGAGPVWLGADFDSVRFGWDNEFPRQRAQVNAFDLDHLPVRNGDLLAFVEDGWDEDRWWRSEDVRRRADHPGTWRRAGAGWEVRAPGCWVRLEDASGWPAQVCWATARAFCAWSGARLPTEAELHRAAFTTPEGTERPYPWGEEAPGPTHGNFDFAAGSPLPTGRHPAGTSGWGIGELVGNGWEWTDTVFAPRPGFQPWARTYPGYSADFFDGAHRVVFGASWATDRIFLRRSFRNWYQEHYPYVFSSFRRAWSRP